MKIILKYEGLVNCRGIFFSPLFSTYFSFRLLICCLLLFVCSHDAFTQANKTTGLLERKNLHSIEDRTSLKNYLQAIKKKYETAELNEEEYEQALQNCLNTAEELSDKKISRIILDRLGILEMIRGNNDKSIAYTQRILNDLREDDYENKAGYQNRLGNFYLNAGYIEPAFDAYFKSLTFYEKTEHLENSTFPLGNISELYKEMGNFDQAIVYAKKCLAFSNMLEFPEREYNLAIDYLRIANNFALKNAKDSIFTYLNQALYYTSYLDTLDSTSNSIHIKQRNSVYTLAVEAYLKYDSIAKANFYLQRITPLGAADTLSYYDTALQFAIKTKNESQSDSIFNIIEKKNNPELYKSKGDYFVVKNNFSQALNEFKKDYEYQLDFQKQNQLNYSKYIDISLEVKERKSEIRQLEIQKEKQKNIANILVAVGVFLLVCLILFGFIFRLYKQRNKLLQQQLEAQQLLKEQTDSYLNMQKRMFVNISHELRTPLTLITGTIDLLNNKYYGKEEQDLLQIVLNNTHKLTKMTNEIRDLTNANSNPPSPKIVKFYLDKVLNPLFNEFQILAEHKKIDYQVPENIPKVHLLSDATKLIIILNNLISNAFKFSKIGGTVVVKVSASKNNITISILNEGRGISKEDLPHIFEPYFQTKNSNLPLEGGMGIGLAICKEYATIIKGKIEVESELGKGALFKLDFPKILPSTTTDNPEYYYASLPSLQMPIELATKCGATSKLAHLLIVEDDIELQNYLKIILKEDYQITTAINGIDALEKLNEVSPDLILLDMMMPEMDGITFLKQLKQSPNHSEIPTLMVTANNDLQVLRNALTLGLNDYILKPFNTLSLTTQINHLLDFAEEKEPIQRFNKNSSSSDVSIPQEHCKKEEKWITEFNQIIEESLSDYNLQLDLVAEKMNISLFTLNSRVKNIYGLTPSRYIKEKRLLKSRQLIEDNVFDSVKAIAYSVGYKSEKAFSRNFKTRFGKSPSMYLSK